MYKVSPSLIGYLLECPRCLWLHFNEEVKRPRGLFPSLPSGMDGVFKEYFDEYRKRKELPPEIVGKIDAQLFDDMKRLEVWRNIDFGRGGLSAEFPDYNIFLRGAIDELLVTPDGSFIILDFKTRGYPIKEDTHEHYQHQLDLYALLFEKNNLKVSPKGYLLFFYPEKYNKGVANFKTELVEMELSTSHARDILKRVQEIISGEKPAAHSDCEYCPYRELK